MTVRVYQNTDPGAPALRGNTAGDLLNLLTKCLVEGYDGKPGAGWSRPYVSGNVAVFRQGPGGNDMLLRVDDSAGAVSARHARVVGYETMSDVDTGSGAFPNETQVAGGGYWFVQYNGTGGAADARNWLIVADEWFFYFMVDAYPSNSGSGPPTYYYSECYYFGDYEAYGPSDVFSSVLGAMGSSSDAPTTGTNSRTRTLNITDRLTSANSRVFAPRKWDQFGGAVNLGLHSDIVKGSAVGPGFSGLAYPNGPDGRLYMAPFWLHDPNVPGGTSVRGHLPGLWNPLHAAPFGRFDTFVGQGSFAGKTFITWRAYDSCWAIETSDTWRG